ncbi:hypothetical protein FRC01_013285 [Tulasnella sp. 417]|nr:hypothetical protein FRC01_013285 [Tulasnella sp. 417]
MRSSFLYTLLGLAATSVAIPSGVEPGVELLPKLIPKTEKRQVSVIEGLQSREIGGGFIAVLPKDSSIPAEGDDGLDGRRHRFLRKDEIPVPESLQEPSSKRALYCRNSGRVNGAAASKAAVQLGPGYTCYRDSLGTRLCRAPGSNNDYTTTTHRTTTTTTKRTTTKTTTTTAAVAKPTTYKFPEDTSTDVGDTATTDAEVQQATDTTPFAFPTTMPTPAAASNTTSSSSRTSSTVDVPIGAANGAVADTFQEGYIFLLAPVLFALGHTLGGSYLIYVLRVIYQALTPIVAG